MSAGSKDSDGGGIVVHEMGATVEDVTKPIDPKGVGRPGWLAPDGGAAALPTVANGSRPETAPLRAPRLLALPGPGDRVEVSAEGTAWLGETLDPRDIAYPDGRVWIERDGQSYGNGAGLGGWRWAFEASAQQAPCVACGAPAPPEAQFCAPCAGAMMDLVAGDVRRCGVQVIGYTEFGRRVHRKCSIALSLDPVHIACRACSGLACPDHCRSVDHLEGAALIGTESRSVVGGGGDVVVWEVRLVREANRSHFAADLQVKLKQGWRMLGKHRSRSMMEVARWCTAVLGGELDAGG